jgi:hypothetical protein
MCTDAFEACEKIAQFDYEAEELSALDDGLGLLMGDERRARRTHITAEGDPVAFGDEGCTRESVFQSADAVAHTLWFEVQTDVVAAMTEVANTETFGDGNLWFGTQNPLTGISTFTTQEYRELFVKALNEVYLLKGALEARYQDIVTDKRHSCVFGIMAAEDAKKRFDKRVGNFNYWNGEIAPTNSNMRLLFQSIDEFMDAVGPMAGAWLVDKGQPHAFADGPLIPHLRGKDKHTDRDNGIQRKDGRVAVEMYSDMLSSGLAAGLNVLSAPSELNEVDCDTVPSPGIAFEMAAYVDAVKRLSGFSATFESMGVLIIGDETSQQTPMPLPDFLNSGAMAASDVNQFGPAAEASQSCRRMCKVSTRLWFPTQVLTGVVAVWLLVNTYYAAQDTSADKNTAAIWFLFVFLLMITTGFMIALVLNLNAMQKTQHACGFNGAGNVAGANFLFLFHNKTAPRTSSDFNAEGINYTKLEGFYWLVAATVGQFLILVWALVYTLAIRTTSTETVWYNPLSWCKGGTDPLSHKTLSSAFGGAFF